MFFSLRDILALGLGRFYRKLNGRFGIELTTDRRRRLRINIDIAKERIDISRRDPS